VAGIRIEREHGLASPPPNWARVWNYWQGGSGYYLVDRAAAAKISEADPGVTRKAREARHFLERVVGHLAVAGGIRQFLDVGAGLPARPTVHEVAQAHQPHARILYIDNDFVVLTHARALMLSTTVEGAVHYLDADLNEPDAVLASACDVLDDTEPVALLLFGAITQSADFERAAASIRALVEAMPSGSYLAAYESTDTSADARDGARVSRGLGLPCHLHTVGQLAGLFGGLELVEPGLVPINHWQADPATVPVDAYGAVARKP
jgi:hypothetical protein